jgi:archaellum component FlaC
MSYSTRTYTVSANSVGSSNDSIIYAIVTNNISELKKLITKDNVNKVIDNKNRYTSLHYAIQMRNEEMIRYLINLDAEPSIKNIENQDAFDMSIRYQVRALIDAELFEKNSTIKSQQQTIGTINDKVKTLEKHITFLETTQNKLGSEVGILKTENTQSKALLSDLKVQLSSSNRESIQYKTKYEGLLRESSGFDKKYNTLKTEYDSLQTSHNVLKRKYTEQETIIDNLLEANKKKK